MKTTDINLLEHKKIQPLNQSMQVINFLQEHGTLDLSIITAEEICPFLIVWCLTHSHTMTPFDTPGKQAF